MSDSADVLDSSLVCEVLDIEARQGTNAKESSILQVDDGRHLITVVMEGPVTDMGQIALCGRLRGMSEFKDGYSILVDARYIGKVHLTGNGVLNLAKASENDDNKIAIVVGSEVAFGMARMYEICSNWKADRINVFTDVQFALQSLHI